MFIDEGFGCLEPDLLDDAIMRPGRLEVQIEITLPDEKGRFDILTIHTDKMLKNGFP